MNFYIYGDADAFINFTSVHQLHVLFYHKMIPFVCVCSETAVERSFLASRIYSTVSKETLL